MKAIITGILQRVGLTVREDPQAPRADMDSAFLPIFRKSRDYTMTSAERMYSLYKAVEYISSHKIGGDIVECGVWRGGSAMLCAYTLKKLNDIRRNLYLYDTFSGMAEPGTKDRTVLGNMPALKIWQKSVHGDRNDWCYASLTEVKKNLYRTGYPVKKIHFIKGLVEKSIPGVIPKKIAVLRLDTDWYASTYHELKYLYPLLVPGGILIIDDYGHWQGARAAVDRYFRTIHHPPLLHRIDYSGRAGIKQ